jgi:hypothetical protein
VPPDDAVALAGSMADLLGDAMLRDRLAAGARRKAETLKAKAIVPRIEGIYGEILAARSAARGPVVPNAVSR